MPPVERAAITGSGGIDTVRGAKPADNAARERNTNAAALDRDIAHLIDCSEGGIARVPRETLVRLRALLTAPRAGLPRHVFASLECTAVWLEKGNDPQDAARELRACLAKIDAALAASPAPSISKSDDALLTAARGAILALARSAEPDPAFQRDYEALSSAIDAATHMGAGGTSD